MVSMNILTEYRKYASITSEVEQIVADSGVVNGLCLVSVPYSTMGIAITSFWDVRGLEDLLDEIDRSFPPKVTYRGQESPNNSSGHIRSAVMGNRVIVPVIDGKLLLGSSQGLVVLDFDGPRHRHFEVQVVARELKHKKINIATEYMGVHSVTSEIQAAIEELEITNALCHVSCLHSTAGIERSDVTNEFKADHMEIIENMVPTRADFKHKETAADAGGHVKTAIFNNQLDLMVIDGILQLAEGEDICFMEYDGPRPRNVVISFYGEESNNE